MKQLDILQDMLDDLVSEKITYVLIPCNNHNTAQYLMKALAEKGIKWIDGTELTENTKWGTYAKDTLYAITTRNREFWLICGCIDYIDNPHSDNYKYAMIAPHAIFTSLVLP